MLCRSRRYPQPLNAGIGLAGFMDLHRAGEGSGGVHSFNRHVMARRAVSFLRTPTSNWWGGSGKFHKAGGGSGGGRSFVRALCDGWKDLQASVPSKNHHTQRYILSIQTQQRLVHHERCPSTQTMSHDRFAITDSHVSQCQGKRTLREL